MCNFRTFLGKEFMENIRSKRLWILGGVFVFLAITMPLLARYINELVNMFAGDDEMAQEMIAAMGEPHWSSSYAQFFANLNQIGAIAVILSFMGTILREKNSGTIDLVATKGLKPIQFVLAKFTMGAILTFIITMISTMIVFLYTWELFGESGQIGYVLLSGAAFSVYLLMLLGITVFFSSVAKSTGGAAVYSLIAYFVISLITIINRIADYTPGALMFSPSHVAGGHLGYFTNSFLISIIASAIICALSLWGAVILTAKKQV